jgi:hypothetical protein
MDWLPGDRVLCILEGASTTATIGQVDDVAGVCCVSFPNDGGVIETVWLWLDDVQSASSHDHESLHLRSLKDLSNFGRWNQRVCMWERRWTMPSGSVIRVLEDPSAAGVDGEGILWPSAVVLGRLLCDDTSIQAELSASSCVLELVCVCVCARARAQCVSCRLTAAAVAASSCGRN